jgi:hypothetical protein
VSSLYGPVFLHVVVRYYSNVIKIVNQMTRFFVDFLHVAFNVSPQVEVIQGSR